MIENTEQNYIAFKKSGRTGNNLFQYIFCKLICLQTNYQYIPLEELHNDKEAIIVYENDLYDILEKIKNEEIRGVNLICDGYFQKSDYYIPHREQLLDILYTTEDYWINGSNKIYIKDFIHTPNSISLTDNDIVMHLRLDDFIQYPCPTSDILPPEYYMDILENWKEPINKVYIVIDKMHHHWEHIYLKYFSRFNPILVQGSLLEDAAVMRDCTNLIHSNSTICWLMSFISRSKKTRFIPDTNFYTNQKLKQIEPSDVYTVVSPLTHNYIHNIDAEYNNYLNRYVFPISFSIPDECIVDSIPSDKKYLLAPLIPGDMSTYIYNKYQEREYNEMYQQSYFALTKMKGGWDCLRHYEILMNGCIPLFENLNQCPTYTMTTYPKELNDEAYELYNSCSSIEDLIKSEESMSKYNTLCTKYLNHTREYCTTSYSAKYFLQKVGGERKNILLITEHHWPNYSREMLWIGLKRHLQSVGGIAVELPKIPFLYDDYDLSSEYLSNCFTFTKRLQNDYEMDEADIVDKIKNKFWDLIIYGKVGPDELCTFQYYDIIKELYNSDQIAFIFGGDEIFNLQITDPNMYHINMFNCHINYKKYSDYLNNCKKNGYCFVRELEK